MSSTTQNEAKIFVSIACLDDPDIVDTVADIYAKAKNPDRVSVGACLQIEPNDPSYQALGDYDRVRVSTMHYEDAKGPIFARYRCEQLLRDEDYYLQIDCHSRFFENWDEALIRELEHCQRLSSRAVISHYPLNIEKMNNPEDLKKIGKVNRFRQLNTLSIKSHGTQAELPESPEKALGISAAMLFMETGAKNRVPYDPHLDFGLHAAEQVLYAARLWTHGYDIFTPTVNTVATQYAGSRERISAEVRSATLANRGNWPQKTWSKVKYLLALDNLEQVSAAYMDSIAVHEFAFGMGRERSLLDYYRYCEIHERLKTVFPNYHFRDSP